MVVPEPESMTTKTEVTFCCEIQGEILRESSLQPSFFLVFFTVSKKKTCTWFAGFFDFPFFFGVRNPLPGQAVDERLKRAIDGTARDSFASV
jgi:hypothetical protein